MAFSADLRCYTSFYDLLCHMLQTLSVGLLVSFVDREVEAIGTVDLDVHQPRAEE